MNEKKFFFVLCMLLFAQFSHSQQLHHVIVSIDPCILEEEDIVDEEEDIVDEENVEAVDIGEVETINNPNDIRTFVAYPSPASDHITIESVYQDAEILMMDAMGRVIYKGKLNNGRLVLDTNRLAPGAYRINLRTVEVNKLINILVK